MLACVYTTLAQPQPTASLTMHRNIVALCIALSIPSLAHAQRSPLIERGQQVYDNNCTTCHGTEMVHPGTGSYDLRKFPKDAKPRFDESVMKGKAPGMPGWTGVISAEDLEALWAYVLTGGK
jgi:mono/diheme cytochrome c family protein